jgi:hypothetical protein
MNQGGTGNCAAFFNGYHKKKDLCFDTSLEDVTYYTNFMYSLLTEGL